MPKKKTPADAGVGASDNRKELLHQTPAKKRMSKWGIQRMSLLQYMWWIHLLLQFIIIIYLRSTAKTKSILS